MNGKTEQRKAVRTSRRNRHTYGNKPKCPLRIVVVGRGNADGSFLEQDYGAAEKYLTFQHDEFSMKPTLDESGRLVPREDYHIAALNYGGEDFAVAGMRSNLRYGKTRNGKM